MSHIDDRRTARIDPVERQHRPGRREARWPVDVVVKVQVLFELLGALAVAPRVHVTHQNRRSGVHLGMFEQGLDLTLSRSIDQREVGGNDAERSTGMTDLGREGAAPFDA